MDDTGRPTEVRIREVPGTLWAAEVPVVLARPAKTRVGAGKQVEVPGVALPLRLVVSWVLSADGTILAQWLLLTNAAESFPGR